MNKFTQKELERIISLYIDGELEQDEAKSFEEYLAAHPVTAREVEILRSVKNALSSKEKLPANEWFWLKFSNKTEAKESRKRKLLSSTKPSLALTLGTVLTVLVIGVIYFKDAPAFKKYFIEKKQLVENSLMKGNILPLFANLNNDDVLNFALFGSIAIDPEKKTALQVKDIEDKGSQIQIVKKDKASEIPGVTVSDFCDEMGIEIPQQQIVDSILGTYKQRLQASVLVSENKEIAFHEQLADMNRAVVSTIAASLKPEQRTRFKKFLEARQAPYALVAVNAPQVASNEIFQRIPKMPRSNRYVVISKDTVSIAEMKMNIDSIRETARRHQIAAHQMVKEQMLQEIAELQRHFEHNVVIAGQNANRVRVYSTDNAFQINLEAPSAIPEPTEMVEMVRPRFVPHPRSLKNEMNPVVIIDDSILSFELPADDEALRVFKRLPSGEFRFEILGSGTKSPKVKMTLKSPNGRKEFEAKLKEMREREQELIDLDSLLRESEKQIAPPVPAQKSEGKKLYEL